MTFPINNPAVANAIGVLVMEVLANPKVDVDAGAWITAGPLTTSWGTELGSWRIDIKRIPQEGE